MNSVVIVAAGSGRRMNLDINKQYIKLDEKEMIAHTIDVFYSNENIDEIIVCIREEEEYFFEHEILDKYDFRDRLVTYITRQLFGNGHTALIDLNIQGFENQMFFVIDHIIDRLEKEPKLLQFISKNLSWGILKMLLRRRSRKIPDNFMITIRIC